MLSQQTVDLDDVFAADVATTVDRPSSSRGRVVSQPSPERPVVVYASDATPTATAGFASIERATAHLVLLATDEPATYQVDFAEQSISRDTAVHVQPGQVHQWPDGATGKAMAIAIDPSVVPAGLFRPWSPPSTVSLGPAGDVIHAIASDLDRSMRRRTFDRGVAVASVELLARHIAAASTPAVPVSSQHELHTAFLAELERGHGSNRSVSYYAAAIGASTKTLSRVTAVCADASPKELIDRRVVLEAKRLLAATPGSASSIGAALGFSEATNFTKFFVRHTGRSPQEFRLEL